MPDPGFVGEDRFTIVIEHPDGTEQVITIIVNVEDPLVQPTPRTDGVVLVLVYALWFFLVAAIFLKKGIVPFGLNKKASKIAKH